MTDRKILVEDWKTIAAKAWSLRLAILASVLAAAEATLPLWSGIVAPGVFAALSSVVGIGAAVARLLHQNNIK